MSLEWEFAVTVSTSQPSPWIPGLYAAPQSRPWTFSTCLGMFIGFPSWEEPTSPSLVSFKICLPLLISYLDRNKIRPLTHLTNEKVGGKGNFHMGKSPCFICNGRDFKMTDTRNRPGITESILEHIFLTGAILTPRGKITLGVRVMKFYILQWFVIYPTKYYSLVFNLPH